MRSEVVIALRDRIIEGSLPPGTRLGEEWVSREMGVSRGPVREALRELENEGLVIVQAYRGAVVNEVTPQEIRDVLIPIRLILEQQACQRALEVMTDGDFAQLAEIVSKMRDTARDGGQTKETLASLVQLDVSFHEHITKAGGQYHTFHLWRLILPRIEAAFYQLGPRHGALMEIADEHWNLLEALRSRDVEVANEALRTHICATQIELLERSGVRAVRGFGEPE